MLDTSSSNPEQPHLCYDLHCHSTASDGSLSPRELVARAAAQGVTHLALTDHDTIRGLSEAGEAATQAGVTLVSGVELSCQWRGHTIHVVGLDFDVQHAGFVAAMATQLENRWQRARQISDRLGRLRVDDLLDRAVAKAGGEVPGRPHFAQALVDAGAVRTVALAFKRYLGAGKPGDVKAWWPDLPVVVGWIRDAGGVAVLAHPRKYKLTATKLRALVEDFQRAGGRGLEVLTSGQSDADTAFLAALCRAQGLMASQGSDFHTPGAAWCELGKVPPLPSGLQPVWADFRQAG
ncbi:MAG: PHP domain-containing protein [Marinobacter sp.]|nr:PHP domain-containing protein [Marinobacter sp.]